MNELYNIWLQGIGFREYNFFWLFCSLSLCFFIKEIGIEKPSIRIFANRGRDVDGETQYEANFVFPEDFGDVGAILIENQHRKQMYVKNIVIDGFVHGKVEITCNSWVHSKYDNPDKRIFFTNKVCVNPFSSIYLYSMIIRKIWFILDIVSSFRTTDWFS